MLAGIAEKEMIVLGIIRLEKRSVLMTSNKDEDDCITIAAQNETTGMIMHSPLFVSRFGYTKNQFLNEVFRLNEFKELNYDGTPLVR